ncbi:cystathionine gamma-synthase family protein [Ningiella sp. W23]|uniref:cystathionine gamma-synthase family protein n=1 Tax=Ningiella sp. W23 TaxID=3023715 RepID=UPI0037580302
MSNRVKTTQLVHGDRRLNKPQNGAVHEPSNNSVLFEFDDVSELEAVFQGKQAGHVYSRSSSGSAVALQNMLSDLEGGAGAVVFSTGMAAISAMMFSLLKAGDHIVVSQFLFGNTRSFMQTLGNFDIDVSFVDVTQANNVQNAMQDNTKMVFCESIANPVTQVADLSGISEVCAQNEALFVIDNTMTPASMLDAKSFGASIVVSSLTKYIGGHGNVLGGVLVDLGNFDWCCFDNISDIYKVSNTAQWGLTQIRKRGLRDMGGTLAPQSCHQLSVGLETLNMRMHKTCSNALALAQFCEAQNAIKRVHYPGLSNHPHHERAREQFSEQYGGILSIELMDRIDMRAFINAMSLIICSTHLGDTRTLILPAATTIFHENGPQQRAAMGIDDMLIRISVGIEDIEDLLGDITQALNIAESQDS